MANETRRHISELLLSNRKHAKYVGILACLAVVVVFGVAMGLRQNGRAATHEEQVLDCHYSGNGAHTHDESCYDKDGNLVCPLPERELHTHTDACYSTEERLVCGLEESEGHTHTDACYDEEGNLICGLEESEGHTHTEDCYETIKTLTCDKEEITEKHVHGPGCFKTITVVVADEMPAIKLTGLLKRIDEDDVERTYMIVNVDAPEGAFPEGTTMEVEAVPAKDIQDRVDEALTLDANKELTAKQIQAVDITFMFDGKEIDPAEQIEVKISSAKIDEIEEPLLVHIDEDVTQVATVKAADVVNADEEDDSTGHENTFKFDTMLSGIYAITEAEPVSSNDEEEILSEADESSEGSATVEMPKQTFEDTLGNITVSAEAPEGAFPSGTTMKLSAVDDAVGETIESAVEGTVTNVSAVDITFYDTEGNEIQPKVPIKVTMTNADATEDGETVVVHVDGEGSASVVEQSMLTTGNDEVVFDSDKFSVYAMVTIESNDGVVTFHGEDYTVRVTYTAEARIPKGTKLEVEEIEAGSLAYHQRFYELWTKVNADYLENEEKRKNYDESMAPLPEINPINIDYARFFNITLMYEGKEIEPEVPVSVEISYNKGVKASGDVTGVIHYAESGTEMIDDVDTTVKNGKIISFTYEQSSFSDSGLYMGTEATGSGSFDYPAIQSTAAGSMYLNADNDNLSKPDGKKELTYNEDGTYTLSLQVTGKNKVSTTSNVKKSNVVIVMDRSSSMVSHDTYMEVGNDELVSGTTYYKKDGDSYSEVIWENGVLITRVTYTGDKYKLENGQYRKDNANGEYGLVNGEYIQLTKVGTTYIYAVPYTGTAYTKVTRMAGEQAALRSMVHALLENNEPGKTVTDSSGKTIELKDIIEISMVCFGVDVASFANENVDWTTSETALLNSIKSNHNTQWTNYEDALQVAKQKADAKKAAQPDEDVYIIFITDGEPTARAGSSKHYYIDGGVGSGGASHNGGPDAALEYAYDDAWSLVDTGYKFYGIFAYGDSQTLKDYLCKLVNFAYFGQKNMASQNIAGGTKDYYFDAGDTSALTKAFDKIVSSITDSLSFGNVSIVDGMTTGASKVSIVDGRAEGFTYAVYGPNDKNTPVYTVTATGDTANPTVKFSIGGESPITATKKSFTYTVDGEETTKTYYSVESGGVEYKIALADLDGDIDNLSNSPVVTWDLGGIGTLKNGYTYVVSFIVWPNQGAYDYVAGLNNNLPGYKWEGATTVGNYEIGGAPGYPSIVKNADGVYSVMTNTKQEIHYSVVNDEKTEINGQTTISTVYGPTQQTDLDTPDPMDLKGSSLTLAKKWNDSLDESQLKDILKDHPDYSIRLNVLSDGTAYNSYTIKPELKSDGTYVWPTQTVAIAPALITTNYPGGNATYKTVTLDGETYYVLNEGHTYTITEDNTDYHFEFEAIPYHPALVNGVLKNVTFETGSNGKIVDGSTATISNDSDLTTFEGNNNLKGGIKIYKNVEVDGDATLSSSTDKFTVKVTMKNKDGSPYTADANQSGYRINYSEVRPDSEKDYKGNETNPNVDKNQTNNRSGRYNITGGTFTVELYDGEYILVANVDSGVVYKVDEINIPVGYDPTPSLTYKIGGVVQNTTTHVMTSNQSHEVHIVNKLPSLQIRILKCGDTADSPLEGAEFSLYGNDYGTQGAQALKTGLSSNENGRFDLGELAGGTYYLVETKAPDGYNMLADPIKIVVDGTKSEERMKVVYYQTGNSQADYSSLDGNTAGSGKGKHWDTVDGVRMCRLMVINTSGSELPMTGGMGTMPFTILGTAIVIFAILTYGLISRRTSGRRSMQ